MRPGASVAVRRAVIAGTIIAVVVPLVVLVVWSLAHRWLWPALLPESLSARAWSYVISDAAGLLPAFLNSLGIALAVTVLCVVLGVPAGRALGSMRLGIRSWLMLLVLLPLIAPGLAVAMGLHVMFIRAGLSGTRIGVIIVHLVPALPYMILVTTAVFAGLDARLEEQARSLGAGPFQAFRLVTLPVVMPGIVTGSLFVFLISWTQYVLTLLIGGGRIQTLPVLLFAFASAGDTSLTAAMSVVFLAPALVILVGTGRYIKGSAIGMSAAGKM